MYLKPCAASAPPSYKHIHTLFRVGNNFYRPFHASTLQFLCEHSYHFVNNTIQTNPMNLFKILIFHLSLFGPF